VASGWCCWAARDRLRGLVLGASAFTDVTSPGWAYAAPAGALAMLTALLIHPVIGIAMMLPAAVWCC
jgi:cyclic-di-AMP phosphodiesterase PgpH